MIINVPNHGATGWQFKSEVAKAGFIQYFNSKSGDNDVVLFQSRLSDEMLARNEFSEADHSIILKMQVRIMMNIVPYRLDKLMVYNLNYTNFL